MKVKYVGVKGVMNVPLPIGAKSKGTIREWLKMPQGIAVEMTKEDAEMLMKMDKHGHFQAVAEKKEKPVA